jgi:hypothetical protein
MSPTLSGILLIRVEAKNNGTDMAIIDKYLGQCTWNATDSHNALGPTLQASDFSGLSTGMIMHTLPGTARLSGRNPPADPRFRVLAFRLLDLAGISNGNYTTPPGVNLTEAAAEAQLAVEASDNLDIVPFNNGWSQINPQKSGKFSNGPDISLRSLMASQTYLETSAEQTIDPIYGGTAQNSFNITTQEAIRDTFFSQPPIANGFGSLTMQNHDHMLVNNSKDVYAVGDRSTITYSDGKRVYDDHSPGDPFQVLVQSDGISPPANWTQKEVALDKPSKLMCHADPGQWTAGCQPHQVEAISPSC